MSNTVSTKICPACQSEISANATKCPKCQSDLRSWFRKHPILTFIGILLLLPIFTSFFSNLSGVSNPVSLDSSRSNTTKVFSPTPKIARRDNFLAEVAFTGSQFVISNIDKDDCVGSQMSVNKDYHLNDYTLKAGNIYEVGAGQFAKKDGTRFNPFSTKPLDFYIHCKGDNLLFGADFYAEW